MSDGTSERMKILVTGGKGFIGSAVVRHLINHTDHEVVNVDKMTYAATDGSTQSVADSPRLRFEQADICDIDRITEIFVEHAPDVVMHLAAESHVDRSIADPAPFLSTNVGGVQALLEAVRAHLPQWPVHEQDAFRFLQVSTDEVFGSLAPEDPPFTEETPYAPRSPYAASKAAADHLVRAYGHTYGLPVLITNCSNNYGPRQFPEKLLPLAICNARDGRAVPVYGDGLQVRDWLHVDDHCEGILAALERGAPGGTWCFGTGDGPTNLELLRTVCRALDAELPAGAPHERCRRMLPPPGVRRGTAGNDS